MLFLAYPSHNISHNNMSANLSSILGKFDIFLKKFVISFFDLVGRLAPKVTRGELRLQVERISTFSATEQKLQPLERLPVV